MKSTWNGFEKQDMSRNWRRKDPSGTHTHTEHRMPRHTRIQEYVLRNQKERSPRKKKRENGIKLKKTKKGGKLKIGGETECHDAGIPGAVHCSACKFESNYKFKSAIIRTSNKRKEKKKRGERACSNTHIAFLLFHFWINVAHNSILLGKDSWTQATNRGTSFCCCCSSSPSLRFASSSSFFSQWQRQHQFQYMPLELECNWIIELAQLQLWKEREKKNKNGTEEWEKVGMKSITIKRRSVLYGKAEATATAMRFRNFCVSGWHGVVLICEFRFMCMCLTRFFFLFWFEMNESKKNLFKG